MKTKAELEQVKDFEEIFDKLFFLWDQEEQHPTKVYYSKTEKVFKSVNDLTGTEYWVSKEMDEGRRAAVSAYTGFPESQITPADVFLANQIDKIEFESGGAVGESMNDYFPLTKL